MACCGTGIVPSWQVAAACLAEDVILTDGSTKGEGGRGSHLRSTGWCRSPQGWSFDTLSEAGWCLWFGAWPSWGFFSLQHQTFPRVLCMGLLLKFWYSKEIAKLWLCERLLMSLRPCSSFPSFPKHTELLALDSEMSLCSQSYDHWESLDI